MPGEMFAALQRDGQMNSSLSEIETDTAAWSEAGLIAIRILRNFKRRLTIVTSR